MSANQYVPIRVSTLRGNLKIPFDAYVSVASKHILFCRKGDSFGGDRLDRLKKKKLKIMFILQPSFPLSMQFQCTTNCLIRTSGHHICIFVVWLRLWKMVIHD